MSNRSPFRPKSLYGVLFALICGTGLFAQTFRIESVDSNTINALDSTLLVTYTVRLENSGTLNNVVPTLTPPDCSFTNGTSYFSTSFAGTNGFSIPIAIGTWSNNTTKDLSFYVHLYNEADLCAGNLGAICPDGQSIFQLDLNSRRGHLTHNRIGSRRQSTHAHAQ